MMWTASFGAQPIPSLMDTLLSIFPERNGWFVEGPLGAAPETPQDALPFFERPRVIVPSVDALQIAIGKLFAASGKLPVKKMTRYDEKPGARGLPGFRGIWCQTENKGDTGFAILTPNQNRFLIWAKHKYYPSLANDSIPRKVRDWYARSVSDYLASLDYKVPENRPPRASERGLPEWLDLYPPPPSPMIESDQKLRELMAAHAEIRIWGWDGFTAFIPTDSTIGRFIVAAPDTLYENKAAATLQDEWRAFFAEGGETAAVNALTRASLDTLARGRYLFAVDRYGRIRVAKESTGSDRESPPVNHAMLFPGMNVLTAGWFDLERHKGQTAIRTLTADSRHYFYSSTAPTIREDITTYSDQYLLSLGHLFSSLRGLGVSLDSVLIRKY